MYYKKALELQCFLDFAGDNGQWFLSYQFDSEFIFQLSIPTYLGFDHLANGIFNYLLSVFFAAIYSGYQSLVLNDKEKKAFIDRAQALADLKFTYVVSCQVYGNQKKSDDPRDKSCYSNILNLMLK